MRIKLALLGLVLYVAGANAATMWLFVTNSDTTPSTNAVRIVPILPSINADGSYTVAGIATRVQITNGIGAVQLLRGAYALTNTGPFPFSQTFLVPTDAGVYTNTAPGISINSGNIFTYTPGVAASVVTNLVSNAAAAVTNGYTSIVFQPETHFYLNSNPSNFFTGTQVTNTAAQQALNSTNALGTTAWLNTNAVDLAGTALQATNKYASIVTNIVTALSPTASYGGITNALGFKPATNGGAVAFSQLSGVPNYATNTFLGITNGLNYLPATNGGPVTISQVSNPNWATNSFLGISNAAGFPIATNGGPVPWVNLSGTPSLATNNYVGISNALGFAAATNGAAVSWTAVTGKPNLATNTYTGISNAVGFLVATNGGAVNFVQLSGVPNYATNTFLGVTNALNYTPATNGGVLTISQVSNPNWATNTYVGVSNALGFAAATNGAAVTWTGISGKPSLATNTYVGISNAVGFVLGTNGASIPISQVSNPNWATNSYVGVSNALGFQATTNSWSGIVNALGSAPLMTNTDLNMGNHIITNVQSLYVQNGITIKTGFLTGNVVGNADTATALASAVNIFYTNVAGPIVTTNNNNLAVTYNAGSLTNLNGVKIQSGTIPQAALAWVSATNSTAGITGALGYTAATNTFLGISNALGYWPSTNSLLGISNALGYMPATNGASVNATNAVGNSGGKGTNNVLDSLITRDHLAVKSGDFDSRVLSSASAVTTVDFGNSILNDLAGTSSVNANSRILTDSSGTPAMTWSSAGSVSFPAGLSGSVLNIGSVPGSALITPLNGSGITNVPGQGFHCFLYTNKTATYRGQSYSFPSSTTAGISELQAQFPVQYSPLNPSGITIELADNAPYYITAPIYLTNVAHIKGQGKATSGFIYVGPTNVFTFSQVTNRANQIAVLDLYDPAVNTCGIINFFGNQTQWGGGAGVNGSTNIVAGDGLFEDFFIMTATNFPCFLLDGSESSRMNVERVAFLGSEGFQQRQNYNLLWNNPTPTNASSVIGCITAPANKCTFRNNLFSQLADGLVVGGNTVILLEDNEFSAMGMVGVPGSVAVHTNAYPLTSILSLGFGSFTSPNTYHGTIIRDLSYSVYIEHVVGGACEIIGEEPQNISGVFCAILGSSVGSTSGMASWIKADVGSILSLPWCGVVRNVGGKYLLSTTEADMISDAAVAAAQVSGDGLTIFDMNTSVLSIGSAADAGRGATFVGPITSSGAITATSTNISSATHTTTATNTLAVSSTGITNNQAINYTVSLTAGTGLVLKDGNGNGILNPANVQGCIPLKPGWRLTGTGVTGIAIAQ